MAASTMSQASSCPPRNHGTDPSADCSAAMAATVCRTWSALSTPGTSGRSGSGTGESRRLLVGRADGVPALAAGLGGVDDEALPQDRVQPPLGRPGQPRASGQVPDEQPVVGAGQRGVAVDADRALEPPVGGVQGVGVVRAGGLQTDGGQPLPQLVAAVDPDVPTVVGVVLV